MINSIDNRSAAEWWLDAFCDTVVEHALAVKEERDERFTDIAYEKKDENTIVIYDSADYPHGKTVTVTVQEN